MKKVIIALVAIVVIGLGASYLLPSNPTPTPKADVESTTDLIHINYTETFNQEESEYFVYFYQEDCSHCKVFEPSVIEAYKDGVPIFVVDMASSENSDAWYDWARHHEEHSVVIGSVASNGDWIFNDGESEELYPSVEGWSIGGNAKGELVAQLNKAFNNKEPQTAEEIEISGTPTLIRIVDGQVVGYSEGVEAGEELLAQFGK